MTEALHEIAHISHAELLTPKAEESLRLASTTTTPLESSTASHSTPARSRADSA